MSDPLTRKALMESSAFENANTKCKEVITPLKAGQHGQMWIRHTGDGRTPLPDMALIGEAITRGLETTQISNILIV